MRIRRAEDGDCPAIAALVRELARDDARAAPEPAAIERALRACLASEAHAVLVAERDRDAAILGYLAVHWIPFPMLPGEEAYVSDLVVARDARGAGAGGLLLAAAEAEARARGAVRMMLNNRIAAESFRRGFYVKRGYRRRDDFASLVKRLA
jgi:GNAT superfamily N-acetyltransferase